MPVGGTAFFGQNQHLRLTTNYINQLNRHGDPAPGVNVSTAQISGSIVQPYGGFEGGKLTITNPWGPQFADPAVGPIFGGIYMYVQLDPLAQAPLARGQIVFWLNELLYIVTGAGQSTSTPPVLFKIAGVALNSTFPGYWDFIQILGIASVRFNAAGAIDDTVRVNRTATPPQVLIGDSPIKDVIGTAVETAPLANVISPVELNIRQGLNF
jgi:hypothetical protein